MKKFASRAALLGGLAGFTPLVQAADWPEYRGANQDGVAAEKILKVWPAAGPKQIWKVPTTAGFSSFVVSGGKAFTLVSREIDGASREVCVALDADSGKELWAQPIGLVRYGHDGGNAGASGNSGGDGPRSTPAVDGGRVYAFSADLGVFCFKADSGEKIWSKDLIKEHAGVNISWKNAASPVIDGDLLFAAGGGSGQALLAFNKADGSLAWKNQDDKMTHATPVPVTLHAQRQVIFLTQKGLVSVDAKTGQSLWRHSFPFRVSSAASPVVAGDIVYCSAGYGVGAGAVRISRSGEKFTVTELWRKSGQLPNHWSTPVYHDGHLYGMFSFKEYGGGPLKCVELATGKEAWSKEGFGQGNVILADGQLIALSDAGDLVLVEATPKNYKETARLSALEGKCWSTPALANGRVFIRSTKEGACLELAVRTASRK